MKIYESQKNIPREELDIRCRELQAAIPDVSFTDWINSPFGKITGWSSSKFRPDHGRLIQVYYHHNLAIVNRDIKNKKEVVGALQKLGYDVPSVQMKFPTIMEGVHGEGETVRPEDILWNELRKGRGLSLIRKNLEALLKPLLLSQKGKIGSYEFAVFSPHMVTSSDDIRPPYWEYDEVFRLPAASSGLVDLGLLVERVKDMPPDRALAISSRVGTSDGERHIPMIDFREVCYSAIKVAMDRLLIPERILVNSGRSLHHYNMGDLFTFEGFMNYMDHLAEQPEIGENWPFLQAIQQFGLLRITPCGAKPDFPEIDNDT